MPLNPHDEEGVIANVAQVLLSLLTLHPDSTTIPVPRPVMVGWYRDLARIIEARRGGQHPPLGGDER